MGGLATAALLARLLPPAELGAYFLALSIVFTTATFARFGCEMGTLRHVAELIALGEERAAKRLILRSVATISILSVLIAIGLWAALGSSVVTRLFESGSLARVAGPIAAWTASLAVLTLLGEIFRGFHDIKMATLCTGNLFGGVISVVVQAGCFGFLLMGPGSTSLETAIAISLVSTVINLVVAAAVLFRRWASLTKAGDASISLSQLLRTSLPLWVSTLSILLLTQADLWIIGAARSEDEVAIYGAATRLIKLLIMSQIVVTEVVTPVVAELNVTGQRLKLERTLRLAATAGAAVSLPILVAFTVFASEILALTFGEFYRSGGPILSILSLGWLVLVFGGARSQVLAMIGQGTLLMQISIATIVLAIGTALALVPAYGALGVAVAFALAHIVQGILVLIGTRWKGGFWTCVSPKITFAEISRRAFRQGD
jgi:O-antigen/teichoic acid export membrane protein